MTTLARSTSERRVLGGVDTHKDVHVAAVIDDVGRILGTAEFPATGQGYRRLLAWVNGWGELVAVGVEGCGSWGAGLARYLASSSGPDGESMVMEAARRCRTKMQLCMRVANGISDPSLKDMLLRRALDESKAQAARKA